MLNATYIQFCWLNVLIFPTVLQWSLFRSWRLACFSGIILACLTWLVVRWRMRELAGVIGWRLYGLKMGTNQMFKEIE